MTMNIAVFSKKTTLHGGFGGMEVQNKLLCEGMVKRGNNVVVFSPKNDFTAPEQLENGVKYIFVECDYRYFLAATNKNSWFNKSYAAFKKVHVDEPFDIVLSQSSAGTGVIERKDDLKIKVVSIAHGSAMGELKTFYINNHSLTDIPRLLLNTQYSLRQFFGRQRRFVLHSNKVIAVSRAVKKQLEDETFPPENLITVINNGVDPFDLVSGSNRHSKKLIYAGNVTKDKGTDLFLTVLKDLRFKDFALDIIGDGDLMPIFKQAITESNNVIKTTLLGKLSNEQTTEKLKNNHGAIFCFPTKRIEGFPMVLVEAMFAGLPVVAYDLGGVSDAVIDGETGILVPFGKNDLFINKLLELAGDPVKMDYMSKTARAYAENNFSLSTMLDRYEEVIKEVWQGCAPASRLKK